MPLQDSDLLASLSLPDASSGVGEWCGEDALAIRAEDAAAHRLSICPQDSNLLACLGIPDPNSFVASHVDDAVRRSEHALAIGAEYCAPHLACMPLQDSHL